MCGRYTYYDTSDLLQSYPELPKKDPQVQLALQMKDDYNVAPCSEMPVIIRGKQQNTIAFMTWGLLPAWSKEPHSNSKLINARKEGLFEKPMWKRLVASKRCVVPACGFYEWKKAGDTKEPYYITPPKGNYFSFAGLWDEWQGTDGATVKTYTIITTQPNVEMSAVHNRMPALLTKASMKLWLQPTELDQAQVDDILQAPPDGSVVITRVSDKVNNPRNNSKDLLYLLDNL